jgi:N-methylhydantoinase A/oxoprolinase/acetone carboxylase beta subunit
VALRTFGLGGDSEIAIDDRGLKAAITLGPRRILPLSLIGARQGEAVLPVLEQQLRSLRPGRHDGRFAVATGMPAALAQGLEPSEREMLEKIRHVPVALENLLASVGRKAALDGLVIRGFVHLGGITPSDALHVLGRQDQWSREAAILGFDLAARRKDGSGRPIAGSAVELAGMVVARLTRQSSDAVLGTCLAEEGEMDAIDPAICTVTDRALRRTGGIVRFSIALDRPLIGLGASAPIYYPSVAAMLGAKSVIPAHADVANAVGAVVGQVRSVATVVVTSPSEGRYVLSGSGESLVLAGEEEDALALARQRAAAAALDHAARDGAADAVVTLTEEVDRPEVEGFARLLEARITATAIGRPRTALR